MTGRIYLIHLKGISRFSDLHTSKIMITKRSKIITLADIKSNQIGNLISLGSPSISTFPLLYFIGVDFLVGMVIIFRF